MTDKQANELIKTLGQGLRQLDKRLKSVEELLEILVIDKKMNQKEVRLPNIALNERQNTERSGRDGTTFG